VAVVWAWFTIEMKIAVKYLHGICIGSDVNVSLIIFNPFTTDGFLEDSDKSSVHIAMYFIYLLTLLPCYFGIASIHLQEGLSHDRMIVWINWINICHICVDGINIWCLNEIWYPFGLSVCLMLVVQVQKVA
jgi:hypothetical protein